MEVSVEFLVVKVPVHWDFLECIGGKYKFSVFDGKKYKQYDFYCTAGLITAWNQE